MTFRDAVSYIEEIPKFTEKHDRTHTRKLLRMLGYPDRRLEIIHVAGSNGKGSVCAMMNQVLLAAGRSTGMFTSPHLISMRERFVINGEMCSEEVFLDAFLTVRQAVEECKTEGLSHPSYFEFLFLMAMHMFADQKLEFVILETGMGGRLDATNAIEEPFLSIITSISLEHTEYLGDTIPEIALEKAGIIKEGCGVIFDGSNEEAAEVIRNHAREIGAPYYEVKKDQCEIENWDGKKIDFSFRCSYDENVRIQLPFAAEYQVMNGALAYKAMDLLKTEGRFDKNTIIEGIRNSRWPGRMQEVEENVYLDGAHNPHGILEFLRSVKKIGGQRPVLLFSMVSDKDYETCVNMLAEGGFDKIVLTRVPGERGMEQSILQDEFVKYGIETIWMEDCKEAFSYAKSLCDVGQKLFCAGSLYLIGELLKEV